MNVPAKAPAADTLRQFAYQPFSFSDDVRTGVGLSFLKPTELRVVQRADTAPATWQEFSSANDRLESMYEDFIAAIVQAHGSDLSGLSYADIACNAGYFCYRFSQMGADVTGVDAGDFSSAFEYANRALNTHARFLRAPYDMRTHRFEGLDQQFDIVTNIAFMCHSSDPTYLISRLASMTRRCLLIYTRVERSNDYTVEYSKDTSRYFGDRFPVCFDAETAISDSLLVYGLQQSGFSRIVEIPPQSHWLLPADKWRAFMALR